MSSTLASRSYIWGFALFAGGGFLIGAVAQSVVFAVATPIVVAAITLIAAYTSARKLAERDFFAGYALQRGFTYTESIELLEITPLLGAGDRRVCTHYMEGPLSDEMPNIHAGLSQYTYETRNDQRGRRGRVITTYTPHYFTICVVDLQRAMTTFPGVFLTPRRGIFGRLVGGETWLDYDELRKIELESSSLANKYDLLVRRNQNQTRLLELFNPSFQVWLSELPFQLCFEFSAGTLVGYFTKKVSDPTSLDILLQATAEIAERIQREGEPLQPVVVPVPPALSTAPPTPEPSTAEFPSPPPARIVPVPDLPAPPSIGLPPQPPHPAG